AVDPNDANIVYCGGRRLLRLRWDNSTGTGTWCVLTRSANANYRYDGPSPALSLLHNNVAHDAPHPLVFDPSSPSPRILVAAVARVHGLESDQPLEDFCWTDLNHGLNVTECYRLTTQPAPQSITAGGTQDNGPFVTSGNRPWSRGYPWD